MDTLTIYLEVRSKIRTTWSVDCKSKNREAGEKGGKNDVNQIVILLAFLKACCARSRNKLQSSGNLKEQCHQNFCCFRSILC